MGTTASKLQRVLQSKSAIKQAIINKGGSVGDKMSDYASAIESIETGSTGIIPTGTITYNKNGLYNVSAYEMADIDVKGEPYEMTQAQMDSFLGSPKCQSGDIVLNTDTNEYYKITGGQGEEYGYEKLNGSTGSESTGSGSSSTGSGGDGEVRSLKKLLDYTKTMKYMFYENYNLTDLENCFEYSDTENVENMNSVFKSCRKLIKPPKIDTRKVLDMGSIFYDCWALATPIDLDCTSATTMSSAFSGCSELETVILRNTNNVSSFSSLFTGCTKLKNVSPINTDKMSSCSNMFANCYLLEKIDITSMDNLKNTYSASGVFSRCYSLKKVIIRTMTNRPIIDQSIFNECYHILGTVDATYNPNGDKDGYIYVPDNMVDTLKSGTNWSIFATQIKPLSELVED